MNLSSADDAFLQSLIPVVMSGIIAVYSLVIAVLIAGDIAPSTDKSYDLYTYDYTISFKSGTIN